MAKRKIKARLACPTGRSIQVRYKDPDTGLEVRLNTYTKDESEAEQFRKEVEAQLMLGIKPKTLREKQKPIGPQMRWQEFRDAFTEHLNEEHRKGNLRESSCGHMESRLDVAERILQPRTLGDFAKPESLNRLQEKMLAGVESRFERSRSPHTVKTHITSILTVVRWAHEQGWIETMPKIKKQKTSKLKAMKGRPITTEEFERMVDVVPKVVGEESANSWRFLLRGLWESALRLGEAMNMAWDKPGYIIPEWRRGRLPTLRIPASMQKNDTEEEIPLLPWFEKVLLEIPESERTGWVFNPSSLQPKYNRPVLSPRANVDWVGKVISKIGKKAGVVVDPGDERTKRPAKFASAHDLRRSCADRLEAAEVPEKIICRVMRHASYSTTRKHYSPGNVQREAGLLRKILAPAPAPVPAAATANQNLGTVLGTVDQEGGNGVRQETTQALAR